MSKKVFGVTYDNHISAGHIMTTVLAIFAGAGAYYSVVYDIQKLKETDVRIEKQLDMQRVEHRYALDKIDHKLDKIYDKLDTKVDK